MRYDIQDLKRLVRDGHTVAASDGERLLTSRERGIRPLVQWLDDGVGLAGFSVADKIVGRAAAMLYVRLGAARVWAQVMSRGGKTVLAAHGIAAECEVETERIINRLGTGMCPMEEAAKGIDDPLEAERALKAKLKQLRGA